MVAISSLGLTLSTFTFFYLWSAQSLEQTQENLKTLTMVTADSLTPLLQRNAQAEAQANLQSLISNSQIEGVSVRFSDGRDFVRVGKAPTGELRLSLDIESNSNKIKCTESCRDEGVTLGYLTTVLDLSHYRQQQREFVRLGLAANACCIFLCLLASFRFQSWLTRPILALTQLAKLISSDSDYSRRAQSDRVDEIGSLYSSFNHMLEQVEVRNQRLRRRAQLLQLMESISRAANSAKNPDEALKLGMDSLCNYTGWPIAHAWKIYPEGSGELMSTHQWHLDPNQNLHRLQEQTSRMRLQANQGIPGHVLATASPIWTEDLQQDSRFLRLETAQELDLKAVFAFPVLVNEEVVAVLEFFTSERDAPDEGLMEALAQIGTHLGRVFERFRAGRQLILARDEAELANRSKSSFLATMSHEIRTPLNAVLGMTGLLLETNLDLEQRDYATTVRGSGESLLAIINDILDFSKIEAGHLELEEVAFDLFECLEGALELVAPLAAGKGLELAYAMDHDVPEGILGDATRLRQILINILSNAIKFTAQGEVVLSVSADSLENEQQRLCFTIQDTGIGIPFDRLDQLFSPFTQVDSSVTRRFGGTGLGLAICKSFVEAMGGQIEVISEEGCGSTFTFTILAQSAQVPPRAYEKAPENFAGKKLLLVDDNVANRQLLSTRAHSWGISVAAFESAASALEDVQRGNAYDVAVLDIQMPEIDGIHLARELQKLTDMPLIAWTSLGRREAQGAELFTAYLHKPLRPATLFEVLDRIFNSSSSGRTKATSQFDAEMGRRHPLKILVADDLYVNQKMMLIILQKMGYQADAAANGLEVLQAMERARYDVIFMDVNMPEMDGLEATRQIVQDYADRPRIIALTANATVSEREACHQAGMDDFLSKPVQAAGLREALLGCPLRKEEAVLDPEALGNLREVFEFGGVEALEDLVSTLESELDNLVAALLQAAPGRDAAALIRASHTIKGSAANFGAIRLSKLAAVIEAAVKEQEWSQLEEALKHLPGECKKATSSIRKEFL